MRVAVDVMMVRRCNDGPGAVAGEVRMGDNDGLELAVGWAVGTVGLLLVLVAWLLLHVLLLLRQLGLLGNIVVVGIVVILAAVARLAVAWLGVVVLRVAGLGVAGRFRSVVGRGADEPGHRLVLGRGARLRVARVGVAGEVAVAGTSGQLRVVVALAVAGEVDAERDAKVQEGRHGEVEDGQGPEGGVAAKGPPLEGGGDAGAKGEGALETALVLSAGLAGGRPDAPELGGDPGGVGRDVGGETLHESADLDAHTGTKGSNGRDLDRGFDLERVLDELKLPAGLPRPVRVEKVESGVGGNKLDGAAKDHAGGAVDGGDTGAEGDLTGRTNGDDAGDVDAVRVVLGELELLLEHLGLELAADGGVEDGGDGDARGAHLQPGFGVAANGKLGLKVKLAADAAVLALAHELDIVHVKVDALAADVKLKGHAKVRVELDASLLLV